MAKLIIYAMKCVYCDLQWVLVFLHTVGGLAYLNIVLALHVAQESSYFLYG